MRRNTCDFSLALRRNRVPLSATTFCGGEGWGEVAPSFEAQRTITPITKPACFRVFHRSADWQSAVSPVVNRQAIRPKNPMIHHNPASSTLPRHARPSDYHEVVAASKPGVVPIPRGTTPGSRPNIFPAPPQSQCLTRFQSARTSTANFAVLQSAPPAPKSVQHNGTVQPKCPKSSLTAPPTWTISKNRPYNSGLRLDEREHPGRHKTRMLPRLPS